MSADVIASLLDVSFDTLAKAKEARLAVDQAQTAARPAEDVRSAAAWAYQLYFASITLFLDVLAARPPADMEALITKEVSGMLKTAEMLRQLASPSGAAASQSASSTGPSSSAAAMPAASPPGAGAAPPSRPSISIRQRVAEELLSTEKAYVRHLTDLRDVFARPLAPPGWRDVTATVSPRTAAASSASGSSRPQPSPTAGSSEPSGTPADGVGLHAAHSSDSTGGGRGLSRIGAALDGVIGRIGSIFAGGGSSSGSGTVTPGGPMAAAGSSSSGSGAGTGRSHSRSVSPAAGAGGGGSGSTARSAAVAGAPSHGPSNLLSADEHATLFDAVCQLLPLHEVLLQQLEALMGEDGAAWAAAEASGASSGVARTLGRYAPFFKLYTDVCRTHDARDRLLSGLMEGRGGFASFVSTAVTSPRCRGQSLPSYLILPIQRVPRYRLLMERLLEATPATHPERGELEACLRTVAAVAEELNGKLRLCEAQAKVADVSYRFLPPQRDLVKPHRHLEAEGQLEIISQGGEVTPVTLFLFNDVYLLGSPPLPMVSMHIARSGIVEFLSVSHSEADEDMLRRVSGAGAAAGAAGGGAGGAGSASATAPSAPALAADATTAGASAAPAESPAPAAAASAPPSGFPFTVSGRQQSLTFVARTAEDRALWMGRFSECIDRLFRAQAARRMSMAAAVGAAAAAAAGVGGCGAGLGRVGYAGATIVATGSGLGSGSGSGSNRGFAGIREADGEGDEGEGGELDEGGGAAGGFSGDADCPVAAAALAAVESVFGGGAARGAAGVGNSATSAVVAASAAAAAAASEHTIAAAGAGATSAPTGDGAPLSIPGPGPGPGPAIMPRVTVSAGATLSSLGSANPLRAGSGHAPLVSPDSGSTVGGGGGGGGAMAGRSASSGALLTGGGAASVSLAGPRAPSASAAFGFGSRASLPVTSGTSLLHGSEVHGQGQGHGHGLLLDVGVGMGMGTPTAGTVSAGGGTGMSMAMAVAAPVMQPDNASDTCNGCGQVWSLFRRRHHCRLCGLLVCDECSQARTKLPGSREVVRVCDACDDKMKQPAMAAAQAQVAAQADAYLAAEAAAFVAAGSGSGSARPMSVALGVPLSGLGIGIGIGQGAGRPAAAAPTAPPASALAPLHGEAATADAAFTLPAVSAAPPPPRPQRAISAFPADDHDGNGDAAADAGVGAGRAEAEHHDSASGRGAGAAGALSDSDAADARPAAAVASVRLVRQVTCDPASSSSVAATTAVRPDALPLHGHDEGEGEGGSASVPSQGHRHSHAAAASAATAAGSADPAGDSDSDSGSDARLHDDEPKAPSPALGPEAAVESALQSLESMSLGAAAATCESMTGRGADASGAPEAAVGAADSEASPRAVDASASGLQASMQGQAPAERALPPEGPLAFSGAATTDPGLQ